MTQSPYQAPQQPPAPAPPVSWLNAVQPQPVQGFPPVAPPMQQSPPMMPVQQPQQYAPVPVQAPIQQGPNPMGMPGYAVPNVGNPVVNQPQQPQQAPQAPQQPAPAPAAVPYLNVGTPPQAPLNVQSGLTDTMLDSMSVDQIADQWDDVVKVLPTLV